MEHISSGTWNFEVTQLDRAGLLFSSRQLSTGTYRYNIRVQDPLRRWHKLEVDSMRSWPQSV